MKLTTNMPAILSMAIVAAVAAVWLLARSRERRATKAPAEPDINAYNSAPVDGYIAEHGDPHDIVELDPTRANELGSVVLVYGDALIVNGRSVPRNTVTGITFNNAAIAYVNSAYQLVISTTLPDADVIHAAIGGDAEYASQVATRLGRHLVTPEAKRSNE